MMDVTRRLASFAAALSYQDLPKDVVERTKRLILDVTGIIVRARHDAQSTQSLIAAVEKLGLAGGSCSVMGDDSYYAPPAAALVNGTLAHSLDFDDTHAEGSLHSSAPIVPAAISADEMVDASGKDLIAACVAAPAMGLGQCYSVGEDAALPWKTGRSALSGGVSPSSP